MRTKNGTVKMKGRILYIDLLKLFAIYLVIWGHALMQFRPKADDSITLQVIYAFHMPLFMMLSGYFAQSSMEMSSSQFFPKKFRQLLLPCISWGVVCWLIITSGLIEGDFNLNFHSLFVGWLGLIDNFWFLKSCFVCYALAWICWRCGKYKWFACLVVWLMCLMQGRLHLNLMFPCFLVGICFHSDEQYEALLMRYRLVPILTFFILLICKLILHPAPINDNLRNAMQDANFSCMSYFLCLISNIFLGLSGTFSCFWGFKVLFGNCRVTPLMQSLSIVGGGTLGIYILQAIVLETLMPRYLSFAKFPVYVIEALMPVLSLLVLLFCYWMVAAISCSDKLAWLMFGHEYRRKETNSRV